MAWAESHTVGRTVQNGVAGISGEGLVTPQPLLPQENSNLKAQPEGRLWAVTAVLVKKIAAALLRGTEFHTYKSKHPLTTQLRKHAPW